jgi:hypothetical protein
MIILPSFLGLFHWIWIEPFFTSCAQVWMGRENIGLLSYSFNPLVLSSRLLYPESLINIYFRGFNFEVHWRNVLSSAAGNIANGGEWILSIKALLSYHLREQFQYLATQLTNFLCISFPQSSVQPSFSLQFAPLQLSCQPLHEGEGLLHFTRNTSAVAVSAPFLFFSLVSARCIHIR